MKHQICEYLKECRLKNKLTQKDVADHLGYTHKQFISNIERSKATPPIKVLKKYVRFVGADFDTARKLYIETKAKGLM